MTAYAVFKKEPRFFIGDKIFIDGVWSECFLFVEGCTAKEISGTIWHPKLGIMEKHVTFDRNENWKKWKGKIELAEFSNEKRRQNSR